MKKSFDLIRKNKELIGAALSIVGFNSLVYYKYQLDKKELSSKIDSIEKSMLKKEEITKVKADMVRGFCPKFSEDLEKGVDPDGIFSPYWKSRNDVLSENINECLKESKQRKEKLKQLI